MFAWAGLVCINARSALSNDSLCAHAHNASMSNSRETATDEKLLPLPM